jgi:hypothetical protein
VLANLFWHGVFKDFPQVFSEARGTTDPKKLTDIMIRFTADHQPDSWKTRAFYESGKALQSLKNVYWQRLITNSIILQSLLETGERLIVVLGNDLFWEAGATQPSSAIEEGHIPGYNWAGVILMTLRDMLWKRLQLENNQLSFSCILADISDPPPEDTAETPKARKRANSRDASETRKSKKLTLPDSPLEPIDGSTFQSTSYVSNQLFTPLPTYKTKPGLATNNPYQALADQSSSEEESDDGLSHLGRPPKPSLNEFISEAEFKRPRQRK